MSFKPFLQPKFQLWALTSPLLPTKHFFPFSWEILCNLCCWEYNACIPTYHKWKKISIPWKLWDTKPLILFLITKSPRIPWWGSWGKRPHKLPGMTMLDLKCGAITRVTTHWLTSQIVHVIQSITNMPIIQFLRTNTRFINPLQQTLMTHFDRPEKASTHIAD